MILWVDRSIWVYRSLSSVMNKWLGLAVDERAVMEWPSVMGPRFLMSFCRRIEYWDI